MPTHRSLQSRGQTISGQTARRLAITAQGLARPRPERPTGRHLRRAITEMGVLQIDSVNVFSRSHYLPLFARTGDYEHARADALLLEGPSPRRDDGYVEYLAHEATFVPAADWPLWHFRRTHLRDRYGGEDSWASTQEPLFRRIRDELAARGPLRPGDFENQGDRSRRGAWWGWDDLKRALEVLWRFGEVVVAGRQGFERRYALAGQVLAPHLVDAVVPRTDAIRELVSRCTRALGVATAADVADYYRVADRAAITAALRELTDEGSLVPVTVEGWRDGAGRPLPAWRHRDAVASRPRDLATILSPFDPLVWFRPRALRTFGLDYRIEIYTPAPRRRFGYYSLPVLVGDRVVARVDLKADRVSGRLLVQSAWWEPAAHPADDAPGVAAAVAAAARWQGLSEISVSAWGTACNDLVRVLLCSRHDHPRAPMSQEFDGNLLTAKGELSE